MFTTTAVARRLVAPPAKRGGIEQNVSKCGNIEKVIRYRPSHITAGAEISEFLPC